MKKYKVTVTIVKTVSRIVRAKSSREAKKLLKDFIKAKGLKINGRDIEHCEAESE